MLTCKKFFTVLTLTISCSSKIQIGFTFLVPAHPGSPGQRAVKRVCVCVCVLTLTWEAKGVGEAWRPVEGWTQYFCFWGLCGTFLA